MQNVTHDTNLSFCRCVGPGPRERSKRRKSYAEREAVRNWSRSRGNCTPILTDAYPLSAHCSRFGGSGVRHTKRAALFRLRRRFDAQSDCGAAGEVSHLRATSNQAAAICRNVARSRSVLAVSAQPNARPHSHRISQPITRFALPETSHLGRRNLDVVPLSCRPITMTAPRQFH
jgi:hypothetical protein